MQFKIDHEVLYKAFSDSVQGLLDKIKTEQARIYREDPDPDTTWSHHLDKILRKWFRNGGGLGY